MLSRSSTSRVASGSSQAEGGRGLFSKVKQGKAFASRSLLPRNAPIACRSTLARSRPDSLTALDIPSLGIAHTSITGAFGNKDLRELQTLITEEKTLLQTSGRTGSAFSLTSTALNAWGASEGPDLADVGQRASEMLALVASAFETFSNRQTDIRSLLKAVRTAEEELDELKKRRRAVGSRSESEEKKLVKMSSENKNLPSQTELLQNLRNEMRELDTEIMNSEAHLSDHKRVALKGALSLKFGGLLELAEKATIVGELGKLLIEEIPLETTPPGYGRGPYHGHEKTARLVEEASKCVSEVNFVPPRVHLLPPSQSAIAPASQAPYLPSPLGHEQDFASQHQSYEQFSGSAPSNGAHPAGPNGLHDDPTMLPMRFADENGPASPSAQSGYDQPQREIGIGAPPISPAAAYRKSYQLGHDQPSPLGAHGAETAGSSSQAPRLDAYGNELPAGEGEGYDQAEALDNLGAPLSPGLRNSTGRSAPPAHRLTLGLGSDIGNGGLMNDVPQRTSSRGPGGPSLAQGVLAAGREASGLSEAAAPHDSYPHETHSPEDYGETSLPYVSEPAPEKRLSAEDELAIPPPSSDGHSVLQPPSAPFAQGQMMSPASEKQSFVDAPDTLPRPGSRIDAPEGQGRESVDLDYYSNHYDGPPAPYQSPLPRPPQIIEPSLPAQPPALLSQQSYSSPITVSTGPSPAEPNMPRGEAELASAAAKREVEREMDSLAYSASPIGHQPPVSPLEYAPREGELGARKINAGAFFKRNGAGGAGSRSNSASFAPPALAHDQGDGGVSEDDEGNGTRPLRIGRNRPHDAFEVGSPPKDVAPPYNG